MTLRLTTDWDKKRFPPSPDLVVLETTTPVPPEAWVRVSVATTVPSPAGPEKPRGGAEYRSRRSRRSSSTASTATRACPADAGITFRFRAPVRTTALRGGGAGRRRDDARPAGAGREAEARGARRARSSSTKRESFSLEDAGFEPQPPARTFAITVDASLRSADGQTLGYTWAGVVENWHERAFTSFGDGHGVWETVRRHAAAVLRAQFPHGARSGRSASRCPI